MLPPGSLSRVYHMKETRRDYSFMYFSIMHEERCRAHFLYMHMDEANSWHCWRRRNRNKRNAWGRERERETDTDEWSDDTRENVRLIFGSDCFSFFFFLIFFFLLFIISPCSPLCEACRDGEGVVFSRSWQRMSFLGVSHNIEKERRRRGGDWEKKGKVMPR